MVSMKTASASPRALIAAARRKRTSANEPKPEMTKYHQMKKTCPACMSRCPLSRGSSGRNTWKPTGLCTSRAASMPAATAFTGTVTSR